MEGFKINIEQETEKNNNYRKVVYTTEQTQLVLMSIPKGDDIDREIHKNVTQFIRVEKGSGVAYLNNKQYRLKEGDAIIIPAGVEHYIKNTSNKPLKLYSLYSPAQHKKGLVEVSHV
jgi:mannose-6-phosphate isomerase-like protein (cupin superfamily)